MKNLIYVFAGILILMTSCKISNEPWENLIKIDLSNWVQINGPGVWNRTTIRVEGNHVEYWLNEQMTLEYERRTDV